MQLVYETHAPTTDNEAGIATGWLPGTLSEWGHKSAREMGERWRDEPFTAIYTSDLARAVETARLAFAGRDTPIFADPLLRECHYGELDGSAAAGVHRNRLAYLDERHPGGESWREAVQRHARFLQSIAEEPNDQCVLVIGHSATLFAFQHILDGVPLEAALREKFEWQPGWRFTIRKLDLN